jgi:hypothetical protein
MQTTSVTIYHQPPQKLWKEDFSITCQLGGASSTNFKFDIAFHYIHDLLDQSSVVGWITKVQHITNENFDDKNWNKEI